jgi:D-glycero-alpha-D-manno-heptose-7-phosphate kinase
MIIARAPVRISFGGGGTDLEAYYADHSGFVLSTTISRYCTVLAREAMDGRIRITSSDYAISETFEPGVMPAVEQPLTLPKAALEWFISRGLCPNGVELVLAADVPPGTGLGSSSAMAVALAGALATAAGVPIATPELAELACALEIGRLGMPIGKQDQYASAFGGLNSIEFSAQGVQVQPLDLPPTLLAALDARLMLFSTGRTRAASSILHQQQADTRASVAVLDALHQIKALAYAMHDALHDANLDRFGQLLDQSWHQKRQLSNNISSPAIDRCYAAARAAGALGGKIAGAGGGGFMLLYCSPSRQRHVRSAMAELGLNELPFSFEKRGACVLYEQDTDRHAQRSFMIPARLHERAEPQLETLHNSIAHYWGSFADVMQTLSHPALADVAKALLDCHQRGGTIFVLGNGGSAATASHFACDLSKGTRVAGMAGFRVVPLTDNAPLLTAWANDTSYDQVFAEQLAPLVRPGDMVVAISVSGNSPNVLRAIDVARAADATTVAIAGGMGGRMGQMADLAVYVPEGTIEQVEDAHMMIAHSLCVALRERCRELVAERAAEQAPFDAAQSEPLAIELGR